jgi:cofilin
MADLSVLRTAKLAMQEDLIDQADFDFIKQAFLKAQQIKAGMDAGFLRQEDFEQARDAFLKSLDFSVERVAPAAAAPQHAAAAHVAAPVAALRHAPAPQSVAAAPAPRAAAPTPPPPPPAPVAFQQQAPPRMAPAASVRLAAPSGGSGGGALPSGGLAEVNDLPRIGRLGISAGKASGQHVSVHVGCVGA